KEIKEADAARLNGHKLGQELDTLIGGPAPDFDTRRGVLTWELRYAEAVGRWLDDEPPHQLPVKAALECAAWGTFGPGGQARPPHLQRLHEGLHLPAAGAGRHPADRDPHPQRRARPALGFRDLQPVDPLEPPRPPPAAAEARIGLQGAGGRARPRRLHAGASS